MSLTNLPSRKRQFLNFSWLFGLMLFCTAVQSLGQGCAACLDSTRSTPPKVQAGYRHAIYLLGGTGALLFLGGIFVLRREP